MILGVSIVLLIIIIIDYHFSSLTDGRIITQFVTISCQHICNSCLHSLLYFKHALLFDHGNSSSDKQKEIGADVQVVIEFLIVGNDGETTIENTNTAFIIVIKETTDENVIISYHH